MEFSPRARGSPLRVADVEARPARARGRRRRVPRATSMDTRRLPHGLLLRLRRQRRDAPPPLRGAAPDGMGTRRAASARTRARRGPAREPRRAPRALPRAPVPGHDGRAWRFTDLRGFDPDAFAANGADRRSPAGVDARARRGGRRDHVSEAGIEIERAPDGIDVRAAPDDHELPRDARRDRREVRGAQRRAVEARPPRARARRASSLEKPLYVRIANERRGRLALLAPRSSSREPESRLTLVEEYASDVAGSLRLHERRRSSSSSSRPRSSSTSRSRTSRARPGTSPRTTRASSATPSSTGSPAASARRRARCGSRTTSPARARPRA